LGEQRRGGDEEERRRMRALCGEDGQQWRRDRFLYARRAAGVHVWRAFTPPVFRRDGSLRRWAKLPPVQLFGARGEETGEWRR
jgi:hypothetical protein